MPFLGSVVFAVVRVYLFCLLFGVLYSLDEPVLSHTSPQGSRGGLGYLGPTSGSCVSPPGPDGAMPPSLPRTGLWCPRLRTPGTATDKKQTD